MCYDILLLLYYKKKITRMSSSMWGWIQTRLIKIQDIGQDGRLFFEH